MGIKENYLAVKAIAQNACIVAVTKQVEPDRIIEAYNEGIRNFGENRIQELERKRKNLPEEVEKGIIWHYLGHLQTNKLKKTVGNFDYIHSTDSVKIAQHISEEAKTKGITQKLFIQVNISEEQTKYGFTKEELINNFEKIMELGSIQIVGLMTIAPFTTDENTQRVVFKGLREVRDYLEKEYNIKLPELSMGMSNDYKVAYEEGATFIRTGHAIFNENIN